MNPDARYCFICFRGDAGEGGVIAEKLYSTLHDVYGVPCFFSSATDRKYCGSYREDERIALQKASDFLIVLTEGFVDRLHRDDEILFELRTAFARKDLNLIAVADRSFAWTPERLKKLEEFFEPNDVDRLKFLDYIPYHGVRAYSLLTETCLIEAMGLRKKPARPASSADFVSALINAQKKGIQHFRRASTVNARLASLGDAFYVAPDLIVNGLPTDKSPDELLLTETAKSDASCWFVVGASGCGKSQLMQRAFLNLAEQSAKHPGVLPLYLNLNNKKSFDCTKEGALKLVADHYELPYTDAIVGAVAANYRFIVLYDALDELGGTMSYDEIADRLQAQSEDLFVFSCRSGFYKNLYRPAVDCLIEIKPLSEDKIESFCKRAALSLTGKPLSDRTLRALKHQKLFGNILFLTFHLLYTAEEDGVEPVSEASSLRKITEGMIYREIEKKGYRISEERIRKILQEVAVHTFLQSATGRRKSYPELLSALLDAYPDVEVETVCAIPELLIVKDDFGSGYRFAHEMFCEYLLAEHFSDALFDRSNRCADLLRYNFSNETNRLITLIMEERDPRAALHLLIELYDDIPKDDYYRLLQVLNHMHRTMQYRDIKAFAATRLAAAQNDAVLQMLLLHTLQVVGGEEDEERYYQYLKADPENLALNAGITMLYYDRSVKNKTLPYYDNGRMSWYPVFVGYKKHISEARNVPHYYRVLRINCLTASYLIENRRSVEPEIAEFYHAQAARILGDDSAFGQKIAAEYRALLATVDRYREEA